MRHLSGLVLLGILVSLRGASQDQHNAAPDPTRRLQLFVMAAPAARPLADAWAADDPQEDRKDPGYKTYKEGYDAILDERWSDAIQKLSEVISRYVKSDYVDDAEYWKAYALSHIDKKKAVAAYEQFMEKHPKSRYIDDVVADLGNLNPMVMVISSGNDSGQVRVSSSPHGYSYTVSPDGRTAEAEMRKSNAMMRKLERQLSHTFAPRPPRFPASMHLPSMAFGEMSGTEAKLDPNTRVRLEALYAIGDTKEDETAFQTLKDVALDRGQNVRLRQAAIEVLSDFKKFDVMPVFVELAKKDTNEGIQEAAIEFIGRADKDRNKSVEALITLFGALPAQRKENVLFAIADVGNDRAVDFLTTVARTNEDTELRSDAVYYLGTIGGEKARSALYQILRNK